jgi:anti-sigma-K factor RskA
MTTHSAFEEMVAAYAVGALDVDDRRAFEAHLATCKQCAAELAALRKVTTGLAMSVEPAAPPADLKARTIARATGQPQAHRQTTAQPAAPPVSIVHVAEKRGLSSLAWLAAAAAILVAVGAGVYAWSLRSELTAVRQLANDAATDATRLRAQLLSVRQESAKMAAILGVLAAPDVVRVDLKGQGELATATALVYWSAAHGVLLQSGANLPALDRDHVLELWVVPPGADAKPLAAGLFRVDQAGLVTTVAPPPTTFAAADAFAITVEPSAGSVQPTTPIILVGKTKKS